MEFCRFCGKELDSEGRCTCAEFEQEYTVKKERIKADAITGKKAAKALVGFGIGILVLLLVGLIILLIGGSGAYKKPVKTLTKALNKSKTELLMDSLYTETEVSEKRVRVKNNGMTWEEYLTEKDKVLYENKDGVGRKHIKCKFLAKEKISGSNLDNVKNFYNNRFEVNVKKAYRVEVRFTMKEGGQKREESGWLCVVKLKEGGWKYCPEFSPDNFDFIDEAVHTLNY